MACGRRLSVGWQKNGFCSSLLVRVLFGAKKWNESEFCVGAEVMVVEAKKM